MNNDDTISALRAGLKKLKGEGFQRPELKTGVENDTIWFEIGSGSGEPGSTC